MQGLLFVLFSSPSYKACLLCVIGWCWCACRANGWKGWSQCGHWYIVVCSLRLQVFAVRGFCPCRMMRKWLWLLTAVGHTSCVCQQQWGGQWGTFSGLAQWMGSAQIRHVSWHARCCQCPIV